MMVVDCMMLSCECKGISYCEVVQYSLVDGIVIVSPLTEKGGKAERTCKFVLGHALRLLHE